MRLLYWRRRIGTGGAAAPRNSAASNTSLRGCPADLRVTYFDSARIGPGSNDAIGTQIVFLAQ
jgi:hypothetical protein